MFDFNAQTHLLSIELNYVSHDVASLKTIYSLLYAFAHALGANGIYRVIINCAHLDCYTRRWVILNKRKGMLKISNNISLAGHAVSFLNLPRERKQHYELMLAICPRT